MSSPCSACTKRCCSNYTVSVNGYDAWLIATNLRLPLASFLIYFSVGGEVDRGFCLEPGGPRYEIALDKVGGFQRGNPCVFWVELGEGRGRCGIYAVRPDVCKTYPAYQQGDVVLLRDDVLCPEGAWSLAGIDVPLFRKRLFDFRRQQDVYVALVTAWNNHVDREQRSFTVDDFYAHLVNVYDRLEAIRSSLAPEEVGTLAAAWGQRDPTAPSPLVVNLELAEVSNANAILGRIREAVRPPPPDVAQALAASA